MLTEENRGGVPVMVDHEAMSEGVLVAFTARTGGVSRPPYDSLNLAATVGDDPAAVEVNRKRVASALGFDVISLALVRQVHAAGVIHVDGERGVVGEADVLVARRAPDVIGILTADCVPVIVQGEAGMAVAHAGWRGLVAGVLEAALDAVGPARRAWVGPSIHACCYEVGPEVVDAFEKRGLPVADGSHVDPGRAAVAALHRAGVGDVRSTTVCTSCDRGYFSYRRDGVTGRQGAFTGYLDR